MVALAGSNLTGNTSTATGTTPKATTNAKDNHAKSDNTSTKTNAKETPKKADNKATTSTKTETATKPKTGTGSDVKEDTGTKSNNPSSNKSDTKKNKPAKNNAGSGTKETPVSVDKTAAPANTVIPTVKPVNVSGSPDDRKPIYNLNTKSGKENIADVVANAAGIPPAILKGVITQESTWNVNAVSGVGAYGLTQLMPGTAKEMGVNPYDPIDNMRGGAKYLSQLFDKYGNWNDALAAYNMGPNGYDKVLKGKRTLPNETAKYVPLVLGYAEKYGSIDANPAVRAINKATAAAGASTGLVPLPGPGKLEPLGATTPPAKPDSGLTTRKVTTVKIDPLTGLPAVSYDAPGDGPLPWFPSNFSGSPDDRDSGGTVKDVTTVYVSPDGSTRTPQRAGDVPLPPGVTPASVATTWFQKVLGKPAANANLLPGVTVAGKVAKAPIGGATKIAGGVTAPVAISRGASVAAPALFAGTPIIIHGGTAQPATFADVMSLGLVGANEVLPPDPTPLDSGTPGSLGVPIAGGAIGGGGGITPPIDTGTPDQSNAVSFTQPSQLAPGTGVTPPSSGGGDGSSIPVRHTPFTLADASGSPFAPQYFNLDDFLGALGTGGKKTAANIGTGAKSQASPNVALILGILAAGGAAFYFWKVKKP